VQGLVDSVLGPTRPPVVVAYDATERQAALYALRRWYDKWSAIARAFIGRRDVLILLGLAHRRPSVRDEVEDGTEGGADAPGASDTGTGGGSV
jgi:hypothetical protein